jgi:hypothetical protein
MVCGRGSDNSADYNASHGKYDAVDSSNDKADVKENITAMMLVATPTTNDNDEFKEASTDNKETPALASLSPLLS